METIFLSLFPFFVATLLCIITIKSGIVENKKLKQQILDLKMPAVGMAYKLVYEDLCKKYPYVMAYFNGTLEKGDIFPRQYQITEMIDYVIEKGKQ